jgi:hypothetical protein
VEDIIGIRWLYGREEAGVTLMAVNGATMQTMWRVAPSIPSQWSSGRVSLRKSGGTLFLTDSEGLLHIFDLHGNRLGSAVELPPTARMQCTVVAGDPARAWLSVRDGASASPPQGLLADAMGHVEKAPRPAGCDDGEAIRACDVKGDGPCRRYDQPTLSGLTKERGSWLYFREVVEEDGAGVAVGNKQQDAAAPIAFVAGYDVKTKKVAWQGPLAFTDDPMHEDAYPHMEIQRGRVLGLYQLATGKWLLGARDAKMGAVLWSTEVPRAVHGTNFETMTVTDARVYLALSSRLEVFDVANGTSLGVVW